MRTIELLSPAAATSGHAVTLAVRVPTLEGRVVGLLNNSKSGTRPFLDRVEELLRLEHGVSKIIRFNKKAAALPIPDEMLAAATGECDVVINGIAD
jgi:NADPH-dependent 2,4-dienoyl-CoA reductase/sulfur reductase-like enzyme